MQECIHRHIYVHTNTFLLFFSKSSAPTVLFWKMLSAHYSFILVSVFGANCSASDFHPSIPNDRDSSQRHSCSRIPVIVTQANFHPLITEELSVIPSAVMPEDSSWHSICWILHQTSMVLPTYLKISFVALVPKWHQTISLAWLPSSERWIFWSGHSLMYSKSVIHSFNRYLLSPYYCTKHGMPDARREMEFRYGFFSMELSS